jgi:signal transduction histidine kinase
MADRGAGIAKDTIEKIFDPFFSTKFTGRGLGLAVALGIAKAHGGCIAVKSMPGQGSVFSVFLPLSKNGAPDQRTSERITHL